MRVTPADKMSVFPGFQQIVGAATIIENLAKLVADIVKKVIGFDAKIDKEISEKKKAFVPLPFEKIGDLNNLRSVQSLQLKKSNFSGHLKYIGIGIVRFTPVVGTMYSAYVWYKASHIKS